MTAIRCVRAYAGDTPSAICERSTPRLTGGRSHGTSAQFEVRDALYSIVRTVYPEAKAGAKVIERRHGTAS